MNSHSLQYSHGKLEVICGPMFSGKSEELIRRLRRAKIAKQRVAIFKHALDDSRYKSGQLVSHNGNTIEAHATDSPREIARISQASEIQIVGIDEIQFFGNEIIPVIVNLIDEGKRVIIAGLDLDFRGIPFGPMPTLLAIADTIMKLQAICTACNREANLTQRLVDGEPAKFNDPIVMIGAKETYDARCRDCYMIDKKAHLHE